MEFKIQRFADGDATGDVPAENQPVDSSESNSDDVQAKIDAAISKAQAKWESDFKKQVELANKEAERLSNMSEAERAQAELENTRKDLEKQKADFEREKLKYEAAKVLSQRNLPVDFVDYLIGGDNESTLENIKTFEKKFNKAVEDAVTVKLKGRAPQTGGKSVETSAKDSFLKAIADAQVKYR